MINEIKLDKYKQDGWEKLQYPPSYFAILDAYRNPEVSIIILEGGTWSGKTYPSLQVIKHHLEVSKRPVLATAVSHSVPHLKIGAWKDMREISINDGYDWNKIANETDRQATYGLSQFQFLSADKMKSHGGRRDVLFVNECNAIDYEVFWQLHIRTKLKTIIDYNPIQPFWVHEEIFPNMEEMKAVYIHSTYKDNQFVPKEIKYELDNVPENTNRHRIYCLGLTGIAEGTIFENWENGKFDDSLTWCYGVDFGATDPDAVVKVAIDRKLKIIYVSERLYKKGMGTKDLVDECVRIKDREIQKRIDNRKHGFSKFSTHVPFICDSSGKKMIIDMNGAGLNAIPCRKYPDSVRTELREMQDYKIIVEDGSHNVETELRNYTWHDKKSNTPIGEFNHAMDAIRYGFAWLTGGANDGSIDR